MGVFLAGILLYFLIRRLKRQHQRDLVHAGTSTNPAMIEPRGSRRYEKPELTGEECSKGTGRRGKKETGAGGGASQDRIGANQDRIGGHGSREQGNLRKIGLDGIFWLMQFPDRVLGIKNPRAYRAMSEGRISRRKRGEEEREKEAEGRTEYKEKRRRKKRNGRSETQRR